jgi:hypothetical protein
MMEEASTSVMSVNFYQNTRRNNQEDKLYLRYDDDDDGDDKGKDKS